MASEIVVREVWEYNLAHEFSIIHRCLPRFCYASIVTEFPGAIFTNPSTLPLSTRIYDTMKLNVDALNIIQLGLTLSDADGNLPQLDHTKKQYVWQFNFCDFDIERDLGNSESIALLRRQGMDFHKNKIEGIHSSNFAFWFKFYGLGSALRENITWITFHGLYHYGFMIKMLTGRPLPNDVQSFMIMVQFYFGLTLYELKGIGLEFGLHGGLEKVARSLNLERTAGMSHQAGPDCLLAMRIFMDLKKKNYLTPSILNKFNCKLYGLSD